MCYFIWFLSLLKVLHHVLFIFLASRDKQSAAFALIEPIFLEHLHFLEELTVLWLCLLYRRIVFVVHVFLLWLHLHLILIGLIWHILITWIIWLIGVVRISVIWVIYGWEIILHWIKIRVKLTYRRINYPIVIGVHRLYRMMQYLIGSAGISHMPITKSIWNGRNKRMTRHYQITAIFVAFFSNPFLRLWRLSILSSPLSVLLRGRALNCWALSRLSTGQAARYRQVSAYSNSYLSKSVFENCRFWYDFVNFFMMSSWNPLSKSSLSCFCASFCKELYAWSDILFAHLFR